MLQERLREAADGCVHQDFKAANMRKAADRIDALERVVRDMLDGVKGCRDRARAALAKAGDE